MNDDSCHITVKMEAVLRVVFLFLGCLVCALPAALAGNVCLCGRVNAKVNVGLGVVSAAVVNTCSALCVLSTI